VEEQEKKIQRFIDRLKNAQVGSEEAKRMQATMDMVEMLMQRDEDHDHGPDHHHDHGA
jgi:hypothetical protein